MFLLFFPFFPTEEPIPPHHLSTPAGCLYAAYTGRKWLLSLQWFVKLAFACPFLPRTCVAAAVDARLWYTHVRSVVAHAARTRVHDACVRISRAPAHHCLAGREVGARSNGAGGISLENKGLFSSPPKYQIFQEFSSHRIFERMYEALNINKK